MNVHDVRANEKLDAFYTLQPLNSVLNLFGLNCIYRDGAVLKHDWSMSKITFLILFFSCLNVVTLFFKLFFWNGVITFTFKDTVQMLFIIGYLQYLSDLFYVYKYGRNSLLKYFRIYGRIDSLLGKTYFREIRRRTYNLLFTSTAISFISCVIDLSAWYISLGMAVVVANFIDCIYIVMRSFSIADFVAQVIQVFYRLRSIGDLLKGYHSLSETAPGLKDIIDKKKDNRKVLKKTTHSVPMKTIDQYESVITKLSGCYLLILKQCDHVNVMYGVRVLVFSLNNFIDMITLLNLFLRLSLGHFVGMYEIFPILSSIIRLLACILMPVFEVYSCEQNYYQINRIIRYIDYLLVTKNISFDVKNKLRIFRSLIVSRPVQFHAVHFYKMNYSLLLSIGSAIITYTMILLQYMD